MDRFQGKKLFNEERTDAVLTQEGKKAYIEAIKFVKSQKSMKKLQWSDELVKCSENHVNDVGPKGLVSSYGSDGLNP